jgi:hypothetical protein
LPRAIDAPARASRYILIPTNQIRPPAVTVAMALALLIDIADLDIKPPRLIFDSARRLRFRD